MKADYPTVNETQIVNIGFDIPGEAGFNANLDNYKFLEMADRNLYGDMEAKLSKYELGGVTNQYCKYMYLIRATHPTSGNTVLHYICNHKSVEMFQLVWPYYLILFNKDFPELLAYYITKKNKVTIKNPEAKTPLDLLNDSAGKANIINSKYTTNLDYDPSIKGVFGRVKNLVKKTLSIKGLADIAIKRGANNGITSSRSGFIRGVLETYINYAEGKKSHVGNSESENNSSERQQSDPRSELLGPGPPSEELLEQARNVQRKNERRESVQNPSGSGNPENNGAVNFLEGDDEAPGPPDEEQRRPTTVRSKSKTPASPPIMTGLLRTRDEERLRNSNKITKKR